jgi:hypothetical protein
LNRGAARLRSSSILPFDGDAPERLVTALLEVYKPYDATVGALLGLAMGGSTTL